MINPKNPSKHNFASLKTYILRPRKVNAVLVLLMIAVKHVECWCLYSAGIYQKIWSEIGQIHCLLMKLDFKRPPQFWWLVFFGLAFICFYNAEAPSFPLVEKEFLIFFFFFLINFHTISEQRVVLVRFYLSCRHEVEDFVGLSQIETKLVHSKMTST